MSRLQLGTGLLLPMLRIVLTSLTVDGVAVYQVQASGAISVEKIMARLRNEMHVASFLLQACRVLLLQLPHCLRIMLLPPHHSCCAALIAAAFKCQPSLRQPLLDELHSAVFPFLYPSGARAPPRHLLVRGPNAGSNVSIQVRQTYAGHDRRAQHYTHAAACFLGAVRLSLSA